MKERLLTSNYFKMMTENFNWLRPCMRLKPGDFKFLFDVLKVEANPVNI